MLQVRLDTSLAALDPGALGDGSSDFEVPPGGAGGGGGSSKPRKHTAAVIFSYLKSYEQMGFAQFRWPAAQGGGQPPQALLADGLLRSRWRAPTPHPG